MSRNCLVPIVCKRNATQECQDCGSNPVAQNDEARCPKCISKILHHSEYPIIQEEQGCFGQYCIQEIKNLNADKSL